MKVGDKVRFLSDGLYAWPNDDFSACRGIVVSCEGDNIFVQVLASSYKEKIEGFRSREGYCFYPEELVLDI